MAALQLRSSSLIPKGTAYIVNLDNDDDMARFYRLTFPDADEDTEKIVLCRPEDEDRFREALASLDTEGIIWTKLDPPQTFTSGPHYG